MTTQRGGFLESYT